MTLEVGQPAPDFTLPLGRGGNISLSNMRGKPVVLYFYPKDDTPGCTTQACDFNKALPDLGNFDTAVIGVSRDDVASHLAFAKKYDLYIHLASDESGQVSEAYGVWKEKNNYGKAYMGIERSTFLIDEKGIVRALWRNVKAEGHTAEVMKAVEALRLNMPYNYPGAKPPPPPEPEPKPAPAPKPVAAKPKAVAAPKPEAKPAAKTASKPVAEKKPVVKAPAKPMAKKAEKPVAKKTVAKKAAPAKKPVKAAAKPVAKKAAKPVVKKAAPAKKVVKASKPVAKKTTAKVVKKAAVKKPVAKKAAKPAAKKKR